MVKYCLHPGIVISRTDGDQHFISALQLCGLYKVKRNECVVNRGELHVRLPKSVECLYPSASGTYLLGSKRG